MNQRIGMYHLDRCHKRLDHLHILTAKKPVGFPHQDRTDSLAARHQTVFHRIKYRLLESLPVRKIPGQYLLCLLLSFLKFFFKFFFIHDKTMPSRNPPFPQPLYLQILLLFFSVFQYDQLLLNAVDRIAAVFDKLHAFLVLLEGILQRHISLFQLRNDRLKLFKGFL